MYGPSDEQDSSAAGNTLPQPRPVEMYVAPLRYGVKYTCSVSKVGWKAHCGLSPPCISTHTVIEFGVILPVHGPCASVAVTMSVPDTLTMDGEVRV
ncbi:MAG: hypothetical protein QOE74_1391 [Mycobacterium sp.]|nr:hypothetical protein [Mycobacterium sp.]